MKISLDVSSKSCPPRRIEGPAGVAPPSRALSKVAAFRVLRSDERQRLGQWISPAPWATIQQAANMVTPGDTVYVAPGNYTAAVYHGYKRYGRQPDQIHLDSSLGCQYHRPGNITNL